MVKKAKNRETSEKLSLRQQLFVQCYVKNGGCGWKAAKEAGYGTEKSSESVFAVQASRLLTNAKIWRAIQSLLADHPTVANKTDRVLFWTQTMLDEGQKMTDRLRAAELLAKASGDFVQIIAQTDLNTDKETMEKLKDQVRRMLEMDSDPREDPEEDSDL